MKIRPASAKTDLPAIVRITNPYEAAPVSEEQMREYFEYEAPGRVHLRLVAVDEGERVIAYAGMVHQPSQPAGKFTVWVIVDPAFRSRGIGSALWEQLLPALQEQAATRLETANRALVPCQGG